MKYRVWTAGRFEQIEIGQKVFVGYCGSGHSVFGEYAVLERATKTQLVFKTESGGVIKTAIDNLYHLVGKANDAGIFVSLKTDRDFIQSNVSLANCL